MSQENLSRGNSLMAQWLGVGTSTAVAGVQSLVRNQDPHKLQGEARKKKSVHRVIWPRGQTFTISDLHKYLPLFQAHLSTFYYFNPYYYFNPLNSYSCIR